MGILTSEGGFEGAVQIVEEIMENGIMEATVIVPYSDVNGRTRNGQARMFAMAGHLTSGHKVPAFCHVHYEKDRAVFTAHYTGEDGESPITVSNGNSNNLCGAILQWVRRLPFIDRMHLHLNGGSQGGHMVLAMAAEIFPACYVRNFDVLSVETYPKAGRTFEEIVPEKARATYLIPRQENSYECTLPMVLKEVEEPAIKPACLDLPWSPRHQWSLCCLDRGSAAPPEPVTVDNTIEEMTPDQGRSILLGKEAGLRFG